MCQKVISACRLTFVVISPFLMFFSKCELSGVFCESNLPLECKPATWIKFDLSLCTDQLFMIGGWTSVKVNSFCVTDGRRNFVAPIPKSRIDFGVASSMKEILICGGYDGSTAINSCCLYQSKKNRLLICWLYIQNHFDTSQNWTKAMKIIRSF